MDWEDKVDLVREKRGTRKPPREDRQLWCLAWGAVDRESKYQGPHYVGTRKINTATTSADILSSSLNHQCFWM